MVLQIALLSIGATSKSAPSINNEEAQQACLELKQVFAHSNDRLAIHNYRLALIN